MPADIWLDRVKLSPVSNKLLEMSEESIYSKYRLFEMGYIDSSKDLLSETRAQSNYSKYRPIEIDENSNHSQRRIFEIKIEWDKCPDASIKKETCSKSICL